ncbi:hypothetical protein KTE52_24710 [Burkholderia multivorans]|uniref:Phage tail protein n=1 Tax=Burkholderia multivorans TaxID=87883 RepID=A0AAP2HPJ3_9BURK|nr:hypothetical protein [Burkholderia multivorans]MBU9359546.1 hypothetical protein [Burkholderia multivorans]
MYRIDDATAATSLPVPEAAGTEGYFTEGNPATSTPATKVRGSWLNMIQEELCAILAAAGISRSKTSYNQVNLALQKMYAPVAGTMRNASMSVTTASATATFAADEIVVATALGGQTFKLANFNKTINLATTGAGGMDAGSAPASGYVALYAIYNPTTGASALLATNATSAVAPNVYGGANMPAGYTASALVSVWPTNASMQFVVGFQDDRRVRTSTRAIANISTQTTTPTPFSLSGAVPPNAKTVKLVVNVAGTSSANVFCNIYSSSTGIDQNQFASNPVTGLTVAFEAATLITPQTLYYTAGASGTMTLTITASGYTI